MKFIPKEYDLHPNGFHTYGKHWASMTFILVRSTVQPFSITLWNRYTYTGSLHLLLQEQEGGRVLSVGTAAQGYLGNCMQQNGNSVTKCRQELHCDGENTFYMNKVTSTGSEIPQCCLGLQCLQMKCYSSRPGEMNVTGYMVPYSDHNWEDWFQRFTLQTGCEYTIRSGKQSNTQLREKGVMKMEGKLFTYPSAWSHAYSCLRGDTGRFKSLCLGKKNRSSLGTRRFGCKANLQVRLLNLWVMVCKFWKSNNYNHVTPVCLQGQSKCQYICTCSLYTGNKLGKCIIVSYSGSSYPELTA